MADRSQRVANLVGDARSQPPQGGQLELLGKLLAAIGLKVVPAQYKCLDPVRAQAMVTLYEAAMRRIPNPVELLFGDEA